MDVDGLNLPRANLQITHPNVKNKNEIKAKTGLNSNASRPANLGKDTRIPIAIGTEMTDEITALFILRKSDATTACTTKKAAMQ